MSNPVMQNSTSSSQESILKEEVTQIGAIVCIRWLASEMWDSGWKSGWYKGEVHGYCEESDILTLRYLLDQITHTKRKLHDYYYRIK